MLPNGLNVLNALRFIIKCALRRFECGSSLNSALNVGNGVRTFSKFSRNTLVACLSLEITHKGLGKDFCQNEKTYTRYSSFLPPSECHTRCSDTEVQSFWCFLLADLSVGVQTAARAPFCPSLQESTGNQWEGVPN